MSLGVMSSPRRSSARRRVLEAGVAAGLVLAGIAAAGPARASDVVPIERGGSLVMWGMADAHALKIPAALEDAAFTGIAMGSGFAVAVMADGRTVGWGQNATGVQKVPASLNGVKVTKVVASSNNAGVITNTGGLVIWGSQSLAGDPTKIPTGLGPVKDLAIGHGHAVVAKQDGTVAAWGSSNTGGHVNMPAGISGVTHVAAGRSFSLALKSDGTVVAWGRPDAGSVLTPPAAVTTPGNVKRIAARDRGGLALLADGSVVSWGDQTTVPATLEGKTVMSITAGDEENVAVDSEGGVTQWGNPNVDPVAVPAQLEGEVPSAAAVRREVSAVIVTAVKPVTVARVSGSAKVGSSLTGVAATFTGGPDSVSSEWLADGAPITGATGSTLALTSAHLGKKLSYRTTAVKDGASVVSTSSATAAVAPPQVVSSVRASAGGVRYGVAPRVAVSLSPVAASGRLDVFRGGSRLGSANAVGGRATVVLGRTALPVGAHTLSVRYAGNSATLPSSGSVRVSVAKASSGLRAKVSPKKIVRKKTKAKVAVRISSTSPVKSGRVTVKLGRKTIGKATVSRSGRVTVKLKKFPKAGTVKIKVIYSGNGTTGAVSKTVKVKVRR